MKSLKKCIWVQKEKIDQKSVFQNYDRYKFTPSNYWRSWWPKRKKDRPTPDDKPIVFTKYRNREIGKTEK